MASLVKVESIHHVLLIVLILKDKVLLFVKFENIFVYLGSLSSWNHWLACLQLGLWLNFHFHFYWLSHCFMYRFDLTIKRINFLVGFQVLLE